METSRNQMLSESPFSDLGLLHTRCPSCQKLFAIDAQPTDVDSALFECTTCQTQFTIELIGPDETFDAAVPTQDIAPTTAVSGLEDATANFEATQIANEIALGAKPELILLWKRVIDDYTDDFNHDSFVQSCLMADALGYAANKYSRILKEFSGEEIAVRMLAKVETLSTSHLDAARAVKLASQAPIPKSIRPSRSIIPSLTMVALFLAAVLAVAGMMVPGMRHLTGIGLSMLALVLGVRYVHGRSAI